MFMSLEGNFKMPVTPSSPESPSGPNSLLPPRPIKKLINQLRRNYWGNESGKTKGHPAASSYRSYGEDANLYPSHQGHLYGPDNGHFWTNNGADSVGKVTFFPASSAPLQGRREPWQKSLSDGNLERVPTSTDWVFGGNPEFQDFKTGNRKGRNGSSGRGGSMELKPGFRFRSISLRNLLQLGGNNKSRSGNTVQVKKVSPPIAPVVPGLVSFASFRVKKGQQSPTTNTSSVEEKQQRYSGSSLGSAGSSYTSQSSGSTSTSSSSSSGDNRSSFGTDDGFLLPPPNDYILKDLEGVNSSGGKLHTNGIQNSVSFDSFSTYHPRPHPSNNSSEMHQNLYGKTGGPVTTNNGKLNGHPPQHQYVTTTTGQGESAHYPLTQNGPPHVYQHPHHLTNQTVVNHYQTQISLEDQGIDMTQSPGRESPSSTASSNTGSGSGSGIGSVSSGGSGSGGSNNGCRHSASSFDSGRVSGSTIYQQGVRYSGLSSESSSGSFRHSYHSSNSSLGSIAPEDICNFDVSAMISQGIPDHEVLNAWLTGVHFECYYQNFIQAGYDVHTISRMTPEDLNAIGVTKPHHRKRLKAEISQLTISDGLLDYIPGSIEEWLGYLRLDEYTNKLKAQGYHNVRQVTNITWEDLDDIGILKLGHQKKFMLAIRRVEDILAGKRVVQPQAPPHQNQHQGGGVPTYLNPLQQQQQAEIYATRPQHHQPLPYSHPLHHHQQQQQMLLNAAYPSGRGAHPSYRQQPIYSGPTMSVLTHQPQIHHQQNPQSEEHREYHPEVISIHVKNGSRRRSMENVTNDEPIYGTSSFLPPQSQQQQNWPRCTAKGTYEIQDGDTTPTNEMQGFHNSTSTLPRLLKNKPIAKIMGGGERNSMAPANCSSASPADYGQVKGYVGLGTSDGYKSLPRDIGRKNGIPPEQNGKGPPLPSYPTPMSTYGGYEIQVPQQVKNPPPPPTRRGSAPGESIYGPQLSSFQGVYHQGWTTQYPPPPPVLSCDVPYGNSDLPLPPHPEELQINHVQSLQQLTNGTTGTSTPSTSSCSSPNNPLKMVTTSSIVHYHPPPSRSSPQNVKSRDPSPDFLDSDLPNNGLMSRGVRRNGSDASFKSNSSTESESIPFANDNAGTIKQQKASGRATAQLVAQAAAAATSSSSSSGEVQTTAFGTDGAGDLLNDIGNMLADLSDELDAILEQEIKSKR